MNLRQQKRKLTRVFAHEVFQGRSRAGWTQQAVADRVFVSLRWYQKIEKGEVLPSFFVGICLMWFFGTTPDALVREVMGNVPVPTR